MAYGNHIPLKYQVAYGDSKTETMKRTLFIISVLMLALSMSAQDYNSLWKQVNKYKEKDLPKSALTYIKKIETKAEKEKQYGHLFAALLSEKAVTEEISSDSVAPLQKRMDAKEKELESTDKVAASMYKVALDKAKKGLVDSLLFHTDANTVNTLTATNGIDKYQPLVKKEADSKYFQHDVISVIASELDEYKPLMRYYAQNGNHQAACIAAAQYLEWINNDEDFDNYNYKKSFIHEADSLIDLYQDLPECGAIAVAKYSLMVGEEDSVKIAWIDEAVSKWSTWREINILRNARSEITNPYAHLEGEEILRTAEDAKFTINARNINVITLKATPIVGLSAKKAKDINLDEKGIKELKPYLASAKAVYVRKECPAHKEYGDFADTISLGKLPLGLYLIEAICDGKEYSGNKDIIAVSDLKVIALAQGTKQIRYVVVDATSGQPVSGAKLHLTSGYSNNAKETVVDTDDKGEYILNYASNEKPNRVFATTDADNALTAAYLSSYFSSYNKNQNTNLETEVFTDRSIYRPGQTVHISAIAYNVIHQDETKAAPNRKLTFTMKDTSYKEIAKAEATTDEYGVAATDFTLPEKTKNGTFFIDVTKSSTTYICVEEYKRPTYEVTIEKPEIAYKDGDTIAVEGSAKTYSGVPVSNATVVYKVNRENAWWWRSNSSNTGQLLTDTIHTDASGKFIMRVPMLLPKNAKNRETSTRRWYWCPPMYYSITTNAVVTDMAGESHEASMSLPLSNRETSLSCDINDKYIKTEGKPIEITFTRRNNAGTEIAGKVEVTIDGEKMPEAECGKAYVIPSNLPSKSHLLKAICGNDTIEQKFVLFSLEDKTPVVETKDWWYESGNEFPASIQFGTCDKNVHAVYAMFAGSKLIESGDLALDSSLVTRTFEYKEEYGDGICYTVAWVRDGNMYKHSAEIKRALPDKTLKLAWKTFRNKLLPGQKEEWTMSVTDKDGKAANANVMAVLYDKSLDAIKKHSWSFSDPRRISQYSYDWNCTRWGSTSFTCQNNYEELEYKNLRFSYINPQYKNYYYGEDETADILRCKEVVCLSTIAKSKDASVSYNQAPVFGYAAAKSTSSIRVRGTAAKLSSEAPEIASDAADETVTMRTNLAETAFFMPKVRTNADGIATLTFTLPESVTTWKFMAFANDKDLRFGMMTDEAIAQKQLMIQPRLPRFLREGDICNIPASVSNISEKDINANVKFTVLDAETEKTLFTQSKKLAVKAGESGAVAFRYDSKGMEGKAVIVRYTVTGNGYSDGEQSQLPVLTQKELLVNTKTVILNEEGTKTVDINDILPSVSEKHLTVEYTDSPEWLMIKSLPEIMNANDDNAISLVSAVYANSIAQGIALSNKDIRKAVSEWKDEKLMQLFDSTSLSYRNKDALARLSSLQNSDGSWSWWKGMSGSSYMTVTVLRTLLRLNLMLGKNNNETMINRAFKYLDKDIAEDVKRMKENKYKYLPWMALDYLYCKAIAKKAGRNVSLSSDAKYILELVDDATRYDDMKTKAEAAIVLSTFGKSSKASEFVKSIIEHTVYREDIGRYFDSYRAAYSWCDYKIPTQVSVVEALKLIASDKKQEIADMKRWLLQSKRTQSWDTPINCINAIYAFLCPSEGTTTTLRNGVVADITLGKKKLETVEYTSALGYEKLKGDVAAKDNSINITKHSQGESWANIFVEYTQNATESKASATGLTITRKVSATGLKVGDKVDVTITIVADRDYDFVTVTDNRPAFLEPVNQLSGYHNGAYQISRDTKTEYYFNMLSKGKHEIKTTYYVSRSGDYTSGTATATCTYAPVFTGRTPGEKFTIDN